MKALPVLLTPSEAAERYLSRLAPVPRGVEGVRVEDALGRVLGYDVTAAVDLPPFDRSTVDGWAVRSVDVSAASPEAPVRLREVDEVRMGSVATASVTNGTAARIPTGGMLPAGADAVVMQEYTAAEGGCVVVRQAARPRDNVIGRGDDVRAGDLVLARGRRLRPYDLGLLAGQGHERVQVFLPPRVAILATGDEVVAPGERLTAGRVHDMNSLALAGAVREAGGVPHLHGILRDDPEDTTAALRRALDGHEMVLVSGGSSVGDRDVAASAIAGLGPPGIIVHGIAVRPGKPTVLAASGAVPVIGLPGNPVSALVIFDLFARPVLERLLGLDPRSHPWRRVHARLAAALHGAGEREDHRRVRLESGVDGFRAVPLPAGSQILTSLVRADGIVVVPPGGGFAEGEDVEVRLLG